MASKQENQRRILHICQTLHDTYHDDFPGFVTDLFDFRGLQFNTLTSQQIQISDAFKTNNRVCVSAGGGIGKTCFLALYIHYHLTTNLYSRIPTTAPSGKLLDDILWAEIELWMKRFKYQEILNRTSDKLSIKGFKEWYAVARTVPRDGKNLNDTLAGFHSPSTFIGVDEASGVPNPVFTALDGASTDATAKILLISNPVSTGGYYYDTISDPDGKGKDYKVLYLSSLDSPLVDKSYAEHIITRYGINSAMYKAKVLGAPISEVDTILITPEDYDNLIKSNKDRHSGRVVLGVDVAEGGEDLSVFCHREGNSINEWTDYAKNDASYIVEKILQTHRDKYAKRFFTVVIDAIGYGAAVYQLLKTMAPFPVVGFVGSEKANNPNMFNIKRAEGYHTLKDQIHNLHFPVSPPERLKKELVNIRFDFSNGPISMEPKKKLHTRIGFSPDYADALMLTTVVDTYSALLYPFIAAKGGSSVFKRLTQIHGEHIRNSNYGKFIV